MIHITVNFSPHAACFVALLQHESEIYCTNIVLLLFDYADSSPQSHQQLRLKIQNSRKQDQPEVSQPAGPLDQADQLVPADEAGVAQEGAAAIGQLKMKLSNDLICFLGIKY